jgi:hypothetical protein
MNLSSTFLLTNDNQDFFNPSSVHECCTTFNKKIVTCSSAFIFSSVITETSIEVTTNTNRTKLPAIDNSSTTLNNFNQTVFSSAITSTPSTHSQSSTITITRSVTTTVALTESVSTLTTTTTATTTVTVTESTSTLTTAAKTTTTIRKTTSLPNQIVDPIQGKSTSINSNLSFISVLFILKLFL